MQIDSHISYGQVVNIYKRKNTLSRFEVEPEVEANLKALEKLRSLPRGTQVDSRIAAIQNLLGDKEIFRTLQSLRWPQGVVCPRCHSNKVVRRDPPDTAWDHRWFYECLNCKGQGGLSTFDDLTGLPLEQTLNALRQWVLCWYLLGFCSIAQIAKVLGISPEMVMQLAQIGSQITSLPDKENVLSSSFLYQSHKAKSKSFFEKKANETARDELFSKSESVGKFKPGPKTKI